MRRDPTQSPRRGPSGRRLDAGGRVGGVRAVAVDALAVAVADAAELVVSGERVPGVGGERVMAVVGTRRRVVLGHAGVGVLGLDIERGGRPAAAMAGQGDGAQRGRLRDEVDALARNATCCRMRARIGCQRVRAVGAVDGDQAPGCRPGLSGGDGGRQFIARRLRPGRSGGISAAPGDVGRRQPVRDRGGRSGRRRATRAAHGKPVTISY